MTHHDVKCGKCGHQYACGVTHTLGENGQGYGVVAECPKCKAYNGDIGVSFTWSEEREKEWKQAD